MAALAAVAAGRAAEGVDGEEAVSMAAAMEGAKGGAERVVAKGAGDRD